ncbi:MAG: Helicase, family [Dehalococcoidia bacterium]|nr:Helicase, family [Dehalococcoidia bacterium]
MRFAGALVARQQFLPGVEEIRSAHPDPKEEGKGMYRACWQPVFAGPDAEALAKLAKIMPHVCRALTLEAVLPPSATSVSVLSTFISEIVDDLVRSAIAPVRASLRPAPTHKREKRAPTFHSIHDQWLYALRSPGGVMEGDAVELGRFAAQIREWRHPMSISTTNRFRLCFRLEEPDGSGDEGGRFSRSAWYVRYLLQAADDPSLLIPAQDAWRAKGQTASILSRGEFDAREYLLSSLGQAAGFCPLVEASLKAATPAGYKLDATGAHEFLTEKAAVLEQTGFGILLPSWWTRKGTKQRLTARANVKSPKMRGSSGLSLDSIVRFDWQVALGDAELSFEELQALAELKAPLVKVRGQWVQMSAEEIQAALALWKKGATGQATVREIVHMALGPGKTRGGIAFEGVTAMGWVADFLAQLDGRAVFEELSAPKGFQGTLRPYQVRGYSWLAFLRRWGLGACLADDMGLGKTIQALALIQRDWESNGKRPVLLVCPTSVVGNWQKEASRFTPNLPVMVHHGVRRTRGAAFKKEAEKQALVISSYALLHRDLAIFQGVPWSGVILDEAQNIKNPETKQARAARGLKADYRIALTGTPVENNIGDLWSILEFLNLGLLGTQAEFKRTFFVPIQANHDPEAVGRLRRLTGPFILRRLKTDKAIITDLPEKMEMKVFCTLTKEQASLYAALVREATRKLNSAEGIQRRGLILATLLRLKQVCNHPAQFLADNSVIPGRSGKLSRVTEMLEETIEVGDRALVFSQFAEMGEILRRHLQETFGREVLFLHGGVPKTARDRMVDRFQADGDGPRIFILSLKAGGTGLNLTRANHVFHFDRWWNPAVENQATDRAFRIGQTKNVQVHKFLCVGTLEEKIDEMIERKKEIAEGVVGTGEGWLTELSTAELKEMFTLRKEAVGE